MSVIAPHLLLSLLMAYPVFVIFKRIGMNPMLTLFVFIPLFGLLVVGLIVSYRDWLSGGDDHAT